MPDAPRKPPRDLIKLPRFIADDAIRSKRLVQVSALLVALTFPVSCSPSGSTPDRNPGPGANAGAIGGEATDFENPISGVPVSFAEAGNGLAFAPIIPPTGSFGDPSVVLVGPAGEMQIQDKSVAFQYELEQYGLVDVGESGNEVADWKAFVDGTVGAFESPAPDVTVIGSSSRFLLPDGSLALITTSEDKSVSDISWLDPTGSIQLSIGGPSLQAPDVEGLASSIVKSYTS